MFTIVNLLSARLALDSIGRVLTPTGDADASLEVESLTEEIIREGRNERISVACEASDKLAVLTAAGEGQTEFDLPFLWPADASMVQVLYDGKILTPTTDYVVDNGAGTFTYQHDDLSVDDELAIVGVLGSGADLLPESTPVDRLDPAAQAMLAKIEWGETTVVDGDNQKAQLSIVDADGDALASVVYLRLTCDEGAVLSRAAGGSGTVIRGDQTNDLLVKTSAAGKFDLAVNHTGADTITAAAGVSQASPILDCSAVKHFDFGA